MIIEGRTIEAGSILESEICIVGAGAAGITLACELVGASCDVIVVESGGLKAERQVQELSEGFATTDIHPPPHLYRQRKFGGTTGIWGGRCVPFDAIDFEARDYLPRSGWPFGLAHLEPYYRRAMEYCEAGRFTFDAREAFAGPSWIIEGFDGGDVDSHGIERFSPPTDFGDRYRACLSKAVKIRIISHSTCTKLVPEPGTSLIHDAEIRTLEGASYRIRARKFVIAGGGMEAVRLLASCAPLVAGAQHLGRYYMCHVEGTVGRLRLNPPTRAVNWAFERTVDGIYARRRFSISARAQRRSRTLNMIARLHYPHVADPYHRSGVLSAMFLAKQFVIPEFRRKFAAADQSEKLGFTAGHVRNLLVDSPRVLRFAGSWTWRRYLFRRRIPAVALYSPIGEYPLDFNSEQSPNPDSRIVLSDEPDRFGVAKLKVDWRLSDLDVKSIATNFRLMRDEFARSGAATLEFEDQTLEEEIGHCAPVGGHHIGTARISADFSTGVVDADGRVHGAGNLFVAGSAIFPTCSHANPTLTIVALAIRLSEKLRVRL